jgi:RND family efflux transporter MFP subunit
MNKRRVLLLSIFIILSVVLAGCGNKVKPGSVEVKRPMISGVGMADIKLVSIDEYNETAGTIKGKNTSVLASKVMGEVRNIAVKEGDRVSKGQLLLTIDNRDAVAKVSAAQAGYREMVKTLEMTGQAQSLASITNERYEQLYKEDAISKQQMDQVATQGKVAQLDFERSQEAVKRAEASLLEAQTSYDFTQVIAPTAGVITAKKIDIGSMALPGVPLLILEDDSAYTIEADVDESIVGNIRVGMATDIRVDSLGTSIQGMISEMAPVVDQATRKMHIKIAISGEGLKSGLYAQVKIPLTKKQTILVPKTAIVEKGQLTGVYVVDTQGVVLYRIVRMGKTYDSGVEILSGIQVGEKIIVTDTQKVIDGGVIKEVSNQ